MSHMQINEDDRPGGATSSSAFGLDLLVNPKKTGAASDAGSMASGEGGRSPRPPPSPHREGKEQDDYNSNPLVLHRPEQPSLDRLDNRLDNRFDSRPPSPPPAPVRGLTHDAVSSVQAGQVGGRPLDSQSAHAGMRSSVAGEAGASGAYSYDRPLFGRGESPIGMAPHRSLDILRNGDVEDVRSRASSMGRRSYAYDMREKEYERERDRERERERERERDRERDREREKERARAKARARALDDRASLSGASDRSSIVSGARSLQSNAHTHTHTHRRHRHHERRRADRSSYYERPKRYASSFIEDDEDRGSMTAASDDAPVARARRETRENVQEKRELLFKLHNMRDHKGITLSDDFTMASPLEDIRDEHDRHAHFLNSQMRLDLQRSVMVSIVSALELGNNKLPFSPLCLDHWSDVVGADIEDHKYDSVLEEMQGNWSFGATARPEVRMMMMLGGSMLMHHNAMKANMQTYDPERGPSSRSNNNKGPSGGGGGNPMGNLARGVMGALNPGGGGFLSSMLGMFGAGGGGGGPSPPASSRQTQQAQQRSAGYTNVEDDQQYGTDYEDGPSPVPSSSSPAASAAAASAMRGAQRPPPPPPPGGAPFRARPSVSSSPSPAPPPPPPPPRRAMKGPDVSDVIKLVQDEAFNGKDQSVDLMSHASASEMGDLTEDRGIDALLSGAGDVGEGGGGGVGITNTDNSRDNKPKASAAKNAKSPATNANTNSRKTGGGGRKKGTTMKIEDT